MKPPDTFECHRLRAKITERQCKLNREGYRSRWINFPSIISCQGCAGLGESAQVPAPMEIPTMKKKKIECSHHGCGYGVKKEGDRCKKHQEPESGAGPVIHDVNNLDVKPAAKTVISDNIAPAIEPLHFAADGVYLTACGVVSSSSTLLTTNWDAVTCEHCLVWKPAVEQGADLDQISADSFEAEWVRNDELAQAMLGLIGCTVGLELLSDQPDDQIRAAMDYAGACHLQASDNDDVQIPPMPFFLQGTQTYAPEAQNQPVAATPPQEQVTAWLGLSSPLAALVVTPEPPAPPLPDTAIVLDLGPMYETLVDRGVGIVTILELLDALFISNTYRLIRHAAD